MLVEGSRPLILFPEGIISRSNDRLRRLMDGPAFIARSAAKLRAKANKPGKVFIVPVALHYHFGGDLRKAAQACLHRHQWLAVVHSSADVAGAVRQARQWRKLVERERALDLALKASGLWSLMVGATGTVWTWVRSPRL